MQQTSPILSLPTQEVHLWLANLNVTSEQLLKLKATISEDERRRAERFKFAKDSHYFIAARGILRDILARYLSIPPTELRFHYGSYGKPSLANTDYPLCFNLSHSQHYALYGVQLNQQLGVDIEFMQKNFASEDIAKRFFSNAEYRALMALPILTRSQAFFKAWTCKEAFIKALGEGFKFPLKDFDVNLEPGVKAAILQIRGSKIEAQKWCLHALTLAPDYVGVVATQNQVKRFQQFFWQEQNLL